MQASLRLAARAAAGLGAALVVTACAAPQASVPEDDASQDAQAVSDAGSGTASGTNAAVAPGVAPGGAPAAGPEQGTAHAAGGGGTTGAAAPASGGESALSVAPPGPLSARLPDGRQTSEPDAADDPVAVAVPAIGVRTRLVRLGLDDRREMEVPDDFSVAGWYTHAPKPGQTGPAVIAGHVDGGRGSAVFNRLRHLEAGDVVEVLRADGEVVVYVVDRVERHPKDAFPTEAVYGDTPGPELRLITCGGEFDRRARSHRDNVVVFASAAAG